MLCLQFLLFVCIFWECFRSALFAIPFLVCICLEFFRSALVAISFICLDIPGFVTAGNVAMAKSLVKGAPTSPDIFVQMFSKRFGVVGSGIEYNGIWSIAVCIPDNRQ